MAESAENLPAKPETQVQSLGQEDPLEKGMATHPSILGKDAYKNKKSKKKKKKNLYSYQEKLFAWSEENVLLLIC